MTTAKTWMDPEERAYPSGALRNSNRRFRAICPDGKARTGICGVADTYSTVPARMKAYGKTVSGFLTVKQGQVYFYALGKHQTIFNRTGD